MTQTFTPTVSTTPASLTDPLPLEIPNLPLQPPLLDLPEPIIAEPLISDVVALSISHGVEDVQMGDVSLDEPSSVVGGARTGATASGALIGKSAIVATTTTVTKEVSSDEEVDLLLGQRQHPGEKPAYRSSLTPEEDSEDDSLGLSYPEDSIVASS